jgi:hypothetical protein
MPSEVHHSARRARAQRAAPPSARRYQRKNAALAVHGQSAAVQILHVLVLFTCLTCLLNMYIQLLLQHFMLYAYQSITHCTSQKLKHSGCNTCRALTYMHVNMHHTQTNKTESIVSERQRTLVDLFFGGFTHAAPSCSRGNSRAAAACGD